MQIFWQIFWLATCYMPTYETHSICTAVPTASTQRKGQRKVTGNDRSQRDSPRWCITDWYISHSHILLRSPRDARSRGEICKSQLAVNLSSKMNIILTLENVWGARSQGVGRQEIAWDNYDAWESALFVEWCLRRLPWHRCVGCENVHEIQCRRIHKTFWHPAHSGVAAQDLDIVTFCQMPQGYELDSRR